MSFVRPISRLSHPLTWKAFYDWFQREGWGADNISELNTAGWLAWWPDFLRDWQCNNADEVEKVLGGDE